MTNMNKIIFIAFIGMVILGLFVVRSNGASVGQPMTFMKIGNAALSVELAKTPQELSKGLSEREKVEGDGMLFVLPMRQIPSFWMKGMRFGLDFVWIDSDKVAAITPGVLPDGPGKLTSGPSVYSPNLPMTHVLELPLGDVQKRGIKVGDKVEILN